ncbi:response regulator [Nitrosarchaeum koreense]|uniref:Response regulator receiver protein n=1 Tax=Nitrosarchaeum koreense MY1 TaxID=1001994 RepID=F9CYV2_9ARCH|nr:response regulator [Nitrosarchaeum koreense]EGP92920.1 Response regulator receiver protein [Nitrosarchaeum koreense MY1]
MTMILIVEDDEELLNLYAEILEINRFSVQTAINGEEAISKYKQIHPDLVVMDGILPNIDGYDAFSQIIEFDKNAKVVLITGYSEFDEKNKLALKQGLISVISKPIGADELLNLAKKYCKNSENKNSTSNQDLERSIS